LRGFAGSLAILMRQTAIVVAGLAVVGVIVMVMVVAGLAVVGVIVMMLVMVMVMVMVGMERGGDRDGWHERMWH